MLREEWKFTKFQENLDDIKVLVNYALCLGSNVFVHTMFSETN